MDAYEIVTFKATIYRMSVKVRNCLRCRKSFKAKDGSRLCAHCNKVNQTFSIRAREML